MATTCRRTPTVTRCMIRTMFGLISPTVAATGRLRPAQRLDHHVYRSPFLNRVSQVRILPGAPAEPANVGRDQHLYTLVDVHGCAAEGRHLSPVPQNACNDLGDIRR